MVKSGLPDWYEQALQALTDTLLASADVQRYGDDGAEYFCRPGEVLVAAPFVQQCSKALKLMQAKQLDVDVDLRVARYVISTVDVPEAVARLREAAQDEAAAAPHHVLFGAPKYVGSPGGPPVPVHPRMTADELPTTEDGTGTTIGIVDTGISEPALALPWFADHVRIDSGADVDRLDGDGDGCLDLEAGHGTFIAGLVQQVAGGADVVMRAALDTNGITDEITVATAVKAMIERRGIRLFNLSLGGYVDSDKCGLLGLDAVLNRDDCVFVAAAGNHNSDRPFFPAADARVVAVAALNARGNRAPFSNYGPWVDACARGQHLVSVYVDGETAFDADRDGNRDAFGPGKTPCAMWSGTSFAAPQVAALIAAEAARSGGSLRAARDAVLAAGAPTTRLGRRVATPVRARRMPAGVP